MQVDKSDIVQVLRDIATLLEYHGEGPFKCRAYETAAGALADEAAPLADLLGAEGRLERVKGIGKSIAATIREIASTGASTYHQELLSGAPAGLQQLLRVPGLGVKKVRLLHEKLGVGSVEELEEVCRSGAIELVPGFGSKSIERLFHGIEMQRRHAGQWLYPVAFSRAEELVVELLRECTDIARLEIAGSLRRRFEVVHDIDLLAASCNPRGVMDRFASLPATGEIVETADCMVRVRLGSGIQAELRAVTPEEYPVALVHLTGSKSHNVQLAERAQRMGLRLDEHGLSAVNGDRIELREEADVYRALGLDHVPPELREGMGEIEAAQDRRLPDLVCVEDYRGVLHCHSTWSDGAASIRDMALAARDSLHLEYLAICDHSEAASYARGVRSGDIARQHVEIDRLNEELGRSGFRILKGCECDILADGSLDYRPELLETMDVVVASVHSRFQMDQEEMTRRLIRAVEDPHTDVLGHPSGRLLLARDGYRFDVERVLRRAAECGTAVEINADPNRLDLEWRWCRHAKELGCVFMINPDAHSVKGLGCFRYGVHVARKGWLEKTDIVNCLSLDGFLAYLARARALKGR